MAWNEPGGNDNDPWGNRNKPGGGGSGGNNGGPPDLDEVFRNLKNKLNGLFGGTSGGGQGGGSSSGGSGVGLPGGNIGAMGLAALLLVGFVLWLASGIYIVDAAEKGVVTRFGAYTKTTNAGPHWHMPWPIEQVEMVNTENVQTAKMNQQLTLTQDENLVKITLSVQYNIKSAEDYLFNVSRPGLTLEQVVESAVREAIGQADMESILTTAGVAPAVEGEEAAPVVDAAELQEITKKTVQTILDQYGTGLSIDAVALEEAQPPDEVQAAFSDAIKAREDKERIISEAEAYENEILPIARGDAERILQEAEGYKTRVEQSAVGESQRFLSLLEEFEKAPEVTRERLYIEAMESVLSNTSKVLMDSGSEGSGNNSLMYLPIDKLINQGGSSTSNSGVRSGDLNSTATDAPRFSNTELDRTDLNDRNTGRSRERGAIR